jgi:putative ABC transport system permease protein
MVHDVKQAIRALLKAPGFTAIVVAVLALGIGANTAIFSIVYGVMLKPLPFADAPRLVAIQSMTGHDRDGACSFPDFADWKAQSTTIDRMGAYAGASVAMTGHGEATNLAAALVTPDLLPLVGVTPVTGRMFQAEDDRPGAAGVAIISETLWQRRFSRDAAIVGRAVMLDGQPFTIVGVLPAWFEFPIRPDRVEVWLPLGAVPLSAQWKEVRGARFLHAVGHVRPGATLAQAQAEIDTIAGRLASAYPQSNSDRAARVTPLQDLLVHDFRLGLIVLLAAVAAVLLIACGNVANLLLARGMGRQREMAIRAALGASRMQLIRQLLTESLVLSVVAGMAGLLIALWGVAALVAASPVDIPRLQSVRIDRGVLAFTMLVSVVTGVFFGLVPALHLSGSNAGETLKDATRGSSGAHSTRTRQTLVVAEVALSLVLLAGAGLLVRSLIGLRHVNPGFVAERAVAMELSLPESRYVNPAAQIGFYNRLLADMRVVPGVAASALATTLPLSGNDMGVGFTVEGHPPPDSRTRLSAGYFSVSPDYFKTIGIPILKGRPFTDHDDATAPGVVIVSDTMARKYWPNEDPIGKRLVIGVDRNKAPREVVGIVGDVKQSGLSEPMRPAMYTPFPQAPWPFLAAVVRAQANPLAVGGALRAAVAHLDPDEPPGDVKTIDEYLANAIATPRFTAVLVGGFAGLALVLAGVGLYGVMAFSVAQRRREIGIRMALGAQASNVRSLVVSQALRMGAIGMGAGLLGALVATRVLQDLLFGVSPNDPATFAAVCVMLLGVLLVAAYLPARRATQVDPLVALRAD